MIKQKIHQNCTKKLAEGESSREDTINGDSLICTLTEAIHIHKKSGAEMCRLYCCLCLWVHMCSQKVLFQCCVSSSLILTLFLFPVLQETLSCEGKGLMESSF